LLHDAGVTHGDIRSPNLLFDSSGAFYIIDFDQAVADPEEEDVKKEMYELTAFLGGEDNEG
jgi:tRNA A-37 threonylcarbamoyl transferase component Bud32